LQLHVSCFKTNCCLLLDSEVSTVFNLLTLGAQDDPYSVKEAHSWIFVMRSGASEL
jgi:hypothetical protein